jgi:hypothetical protein
MPRAEGGVTSEEPTMSARTRFGRLLAALLALCAGAAFAASVDSNYLPDTDFSGYHTYKWVVVQDAPSLDNIIDEQIKRSVDKQLQAKGWARTEGEADAYVAAQVAIENRRELTVYGGYGWGWYGGGPSHASERSIDVGTLTVDVYDPKIQKLVWRGSATETLKSKSTPEKRQERLDKAMTKLFKKFPPKKK